MTTEEATDLDLLVLSYCHFAVMPLPFLLRKDVDCCLNMPHHGVTRGAFYDELIRLAERGWLEIRYGPRVNLPRREMDALRATGWVEPEDLPEDEVLDTAAAWRILNVTKARNSYLTRHIRLSLTEAGGAVWSRFARPKWHLFVGQDGPEIVDDCVQLCLRATTRSMAHLAMDLLQERAMSFPRPERYSITEIGAWEPLPWKKLARGYALRIDAGAKIGTAHGEAYRGGFRSVEGGASELVGHLESLWSLEFHKQLRTLRNVTPTFHNYLR